MGSVLECLPHGSRVAVVRLRSLGDCVLTTPALDILRRSRPDLRIGVVVEDRFRALFEDNPDIDDVLEPSLLAVRKYRARLCLNLHGGTRSAYLSALSGCEHRAGFGHFRNRWAYNLHIPRAQEILGEERSVHTAEHLASAMFWLGAKVCEIPRAKLVARGAVSGFDARGAASGFDARGAVSGFDARGAASGFDARSAASSFDVRGAVSGFDARNAATSFDAHGASGKRIAVIHPVAATPEKTWRADGFLAVAGRLNELGLEPVFIGAAADDLAPFRAYRTVAGAPLSEIKTLLAGASFFVGNDSGPAHMAAAFGLPVVVIFGSSNPAIWGPWRTASEVVRAEGGIARVETSQVMDALERLRVPA